MNIFNIIYALAFSVPLISLAAEVPSEKWSACSADEDCIEVKYTCAGGVVNKRFIKEANDYYKLLNAQSNCIEIPPTELQKKVPYKVFCRSKKCGVQRVNSKAPGFS